MAKNEATEPKTFVEKVLAFQKSDDVSNVKNKLAAILKWWNKKIDIATRNIATLERYLADKLEDLNERIEEAKLAVDEAYLNISTEHMTKDERESYVSDYEGQIADAMEVVTDLEESIERATKVYTEEVKNLNEAIAKYKVQIARISE
jgi:DNA repair exonuclease SbcCD ATPase subunit